MEKRKTKLSKMLLQFDEVTDEKLNIEENLERIISQVFSAVDHVKTNHDSMKQKEISDVHKYCIDVLKQLTEVNSVLEILVEENPLKELHCKEKKFIPGSSLAAVPESNSHSFIPKVEVQCGSLETLSEAAPSQNNLNVRQKTDLLEDGEDNIQSLKQSVKDISATVGLNKKNFLDMKDYYEKSSNNFTNHISEAIFTDSSSSESNNARIFEIPEKDTNMEQSSSHFDNSSDENTVKESPTKSSSPMISFSEESSTETDLDIPSVVPELQTISTNSPDLIANVNKSNTWTALEKLNNYRPTTEDNSFEMLVSPDIKLIPCVQNFLLPPDESQSKKKKGKKKKNGDNKTIYELKQKETPTVGQECVISHVESPSEFYIHIVDDCTPLIDDFNDEINIYYSKQALNPRYKSKEEALNDIGRFCVAYVEKNGAWYRGEIIDGYINEKHDEVSIQMVDYGSKKLISYKHMRPLTDSLCAYPMLAIKCHFPLLYPPNSTHTHRLTKWPTRSIEGLLNLSGIFSNDNNSEFLKIVYAHQEQNSLAIDLHYPKSDNEEDTLGQVLMDTGLAVQLIDDYDENQMDLELFIDDIDEIEIENINEAITGYDPKDEARICRFTKSDGTCFKGKNCKLEHVPLSKDGFTTDKEIVFTEAMYPLSLPPIGTNIKILITGYKNSCRFFAQILNEPQTVGNKKYMMDREFYLLLEDMNKSKVIKTYDNFKVAPASGEIVVVKHWKQWSRGIVREISMGDDAGKAQAQVYLLDFGEKIQVPFKEMRKIKPHHLKLPFQAVECYIHNYEANTNCSQKKAKEFFFKNLYFHNFTVKTMSTYLPLKVELKSKNGFIDVGQTLEANGFAVRRFEDMNIVDNCPLDLC